MMLEKVVIERSDKKTMFPCYLHVFLQSSSDHCFLPAQSLRHRAEVTSQFPSPGLSRSGVSSSSSARKPARLFKASVK